MGALAPLLDSDVVTTHAIIELNVTALTRLTYAFALAAVGRGGGTLINISSVVGVTPELLNGVYGASKAFVLALNQSLHHELAERGIRVQVVVPGSRRPTSGQSQACRSKSAPASGIGDVRR